MPAFEYLQETFIDTYDFTDPKYADAHGLVTSAEKQFTGFANAAGKEGWELVSVLKTHSISGFSCFFKRELPEYKSIDGVDVPKRKKDKGPLIPAATVAKLAEVDKKVEQLVVGPANPSGDSKLI